MDNSKLYSQPEDIWNAYSTLSAVSPMFTIAAAFGNVHGVYKPGNVKLEVFTRKRKKERKKEEEEEENRQNKTKRKKMTVMMMTTTTTTTMMNK